MHQCPPQAREWDKTPFLFTVNGFTSLYTVVEGVPFRGVNSYQYELWLCMIKTTYTALTLAQ